MFPFQDRWAWYLGNRYVHLTEATQDRLEEFQEPYRSVLKDRAGRMTVAVRVRLGVLFLMNLGFIATGLAWAARYLPALEQIEALVGALAGHLTAVSLGFTLLWLLLTRYLGQLEADMIASMALGTPGRRPTVDEMRVVEADEARS